MEYTHYWTVTKMCCLRSSVVKVYPTGLYILEVSDISNSIIHTMLVSCTSGQGLQGCIRNYIVLHVDAPGFPYPLGGSSPYHYDPKTGYPKPEVRASVIMCTV